MVTRTRRCTYSRAGCLAPTFCKRPVKGGAALVVRDVVANLLHRLGMVGAIVIASALIFGAVAGGGIVNRLDTTPTASSGQPQGTESGGKTTRPATNGHQASSDAQHSKAKQVCRPAKRLF